MGATNARNLYKKSKLCLEGIVTYIYTVPDFCMQLSLKCVQKSKCMEVEQQTYYNGGAIPTDNKVHKSTYLCATNKMIVAIITVHSCINSTNGNC